MVVIIGIDPGTIITGYGIIMLNDKQYHYIQSGIIKCSISYSSRDRLKIINNKLNDIIKFYNPKIIVIENIFIYKNWSTSLKLGETIGWIISNKNICNKCVLYYSNCEIRRIINKIKGNKKDINIHICNILKNNSIYYRDATDALSVAIAYCYNSSSYLKNKKIFNYGLIIWELFIIIIILLIINDNIIK